MITLNWTYKSFDELSPLELYRILQLRSRVFVVEQDCVYLDTDDKDQRSFHYCGWDGDVLVAYVRILPPGLAYENRSSIGRVVSNPDYRGTGAGRLLMKQAIEKTFAAFPGYDIKIGAQLYLFEFYRSLGFEKSGPEYLEDGIPHIEMTLKH